SCMVGSRSALAGLLHCRGAFALLTSLDLGVHSTGVALVAGSAAIADRAGLFLRHGCLALAGIRLAAGLAGRAALIALALLGRLARRRLLLAGAGSVVRSGRCRGAVLGCGGLCRGLAGLLLG